MKKLILIALFFCLPTTSYAARGFGSTFGTGSTDSVETGYSTAVTQNNSYSIWVNINGIGGGTFGAAFRQGVGSVGLWGLGDQSLATLLTVRQPFSTADGTWTFSLPSANKWEHVCATYNGSSTSNTPVVYINGTSVSVTTSIAPTGSFSAQSTNIFIGNAVAANRNWDGSLAEFSYWANALLTANDCLSLASGASPLRVHGGATLYIPLYGQLANEQNWGPSHLAQTITGTKFQPHAPVSLYPNEVRGQ